MPARVTRIHWTICIARLILPASIHLQAADLSDNHALSIRIDDFGGFHRHGRPRQPERLARVASWARVDARGFTSNHSHVYRSSSSRWFPRREGRPHPGARRLDVLGRNDVWPPVRSDTPSPRDAFATTACHRSRALRAGTRRREELTTLFIEGATSTRGRTSDSVRATRRDNVTFVINRNITTRSLHFQCRSRVLQGSLS